MRVARSKNVAMLWRRMQSGDEVGDIQASSASPIGGGFITMHGGSSLGNVSNIWSFKIKILCFTYVQVDHLLPFEYPLPANYDKSLCASKRTEKSKVAVDPLATATPMTSHLPSAVKVQIIQSDTYLRCRPCELYLGADTTHGQLRMHVFYDSNVYKEVLIDQWLEDIRMATI
jgi:hypothetical protein